MIDKGTLRTVFLDNYFKGILITNRTDKTCYVDIED